MSYTQLSLSERYQINALKSAKHSNKFIAKQLNRSPSTISRELRRNISMRGYRANHAHERALTRRATNSYSIISTVWEWVVTKLKEGWSPEQIAGVHGQISHTSIYRYLWKDKKQGGNLYQSLRRKAKPYRKRLTTETRGRASTIRYPYMSVLVVWMSVHVLATGKQIPLSVRTTNKPLLR